MKDLPGDFEPEDFDSPVISAGAKNPSRPVKPNFGRKFFSRVSQSTVSGAISESLFLSQAVRPKGRCHPLSTLAQGNEHIRRKLARERLRRAWVEADEVREQRRQEDSQHDLLAELRSMNDLQECPDWRSTVEWPELPSPTETYRQPQTFWELHELQQMCAIEFDDGMSALDDVGPRLWQFHNVARFFSVNCQ